MEKPEKSWTELLRTAIKESGMSFRKLEELSGVSAGAINRFANGRRDITLSIADKIWKALHEAKSDR